MLRSIAAWLKARPVPVAAGLYALLAVVMVGQGLLPDRALSAADLIWVATPWADGTPDGVRLFGTNPELADSVVVFEPFLQYTRERLPDIPLWNPHISGGRPYLANMQSAIFSPFSLPAYVLPFWKSLAVIAVLKLWLASFGTFLLGRALGMRFGGALLAGLVYGFGLWMVAWLTWPLASVFALIPWLLLLTDRLVRRPDPLVAAGVALVTGAIFFSGHPESAFHALVMACGFLVLRLVQARRGEIVPGGSAARCVLTFAAALAAGAALAAVVILPFLELLRDSGDLEQRADATPAIVLPKYLFAMLVPDWWGRPTQIRFEGFLIERAFYVGVLPLLLAFAALLLRPSLVRIALAGAAALSLAVVVGTPGIFDAVSELPGFRTAHNTRLTTIFTMCTALLAGFGLSDLIERRPVGRRAAALLAAAAIVLIALPVVLAAGIGPSASLLWSSVKLASGFADTPLADPAQIDAQRDLVRLAGLVLLLALGCAAVALFAGRARFGLTGGVLAALALLLVVVDLFRAGMGQNPALELDHVRQPTTPALEHLSAQGLDRFAGLTPSFGITPLPPDLAMRYDLYDARGYDYPIEGRYWRLWRRYVIPGVGFTPPTTLADTSPEALRALRLLSVTSLLDQVTEDPRGRLPVTYEGPDGRIYGNPGAVPRAFVAPAQRVVAGEQAALEAIGETDFDPRREVIVEEPIEGVPDSAGAAGGRARIVSYEPERVKIEASADAPGVVVLTDTWYPGWKARVDGEEVDVERVDYVMRGVPVEPGEHTIEFTYEPASFRVGAAISVIALVGIAGAAVIGLRRRRRAR